MISFALIFLAMVRTPSVRSVTWRNGLYGRRQAIRICESNATDCANHPSWSPIRKRRNRCYLDAAILTPAHEQRPGARRPRSREAEPRRAGIPVEEVADTDAGRSVLRDGRGLVVQEVVHGGVHRHGGIPVETGRAGAVLRWERRGACQAHHRSGGGRQPGRKEGRLGDGVE